MTKFESLFPLLMIVSCSSLEPIGNWRALNKIEQKSDRKWELQRQYQEAVVRKLESTASFKDVPSTDGKVSGFESADAFLKYECLYDKKTELLNTEKFKIQVSKGGWQFQRNRDMRLNFSEICSTNEKLSQKVDCSKAFAQSCIFADYKYTLLIFSYI